MNIYGLKIHSIVLLSTLVLIAMLSASYAQNVSVMERLNLLSQKTGDKSNEESAETKQNNSNALSERPSLFFTYWEHIALLDAKRTARDPSSRVNAPSKREVDQAARRSIREEEVKPKPPPEEREISLGGIVYASSEDWTIWLNGQRVMPNALPEEIININVAEDYIEMRWLDDYTMQIFPIRLRAHQRFNLDTRIFLPG